MYHTTLVWIAQSCLLGHLEKVQKIVPPQKVVSIFVISYIYMNHLVWAFMFMLFWQKIKWTWKPFQAQGETLSPQI